MKPRSSCCEQPLVNRSSWQRIYSLQFLCSFSFSTFKVIAQALENLLGNIDCIFTSELHEIKDRGVDLADMAFRRWKKTNKQKNSEMIPVIFASRVRTLRTWYICISKGTVKRTLVCIYILWSSNAHQSCTLRLLCIKYLMLAVHPWVHYQQTGKS